MFQCPYFKNCSRDFFDGYLQSAQGVSFVLEHEYCQVHYEKCARYTVASQIKPETVPEDLYPGEMRSALELIMLSDPRPLEVAMSEK